MGSLLEYTAPPPSSLPPSGAAGGDLAGTYPNPALANTAQARTDLGLGSSATHPATDFDASGAAAAAQAAAATDATTKANAAQAAAIAASDPVGTAATLLADAPKPWLAMVGSGLYFKAPGTPTVLGFTGNTGYMYGTPILIPRALTVTRIAVKVTIASLAGGLLRLGIWNVDQTTALITSLVLDAGTIALDSATYQEITISQALPVGIYALSAVAQGASDTGTIRAIQRIPIQLGDLTNGSNLLGNSNSGWLSNGGTSGALPANWPSFLNGASTDIVPDIALKAA